MTSQRATKHREMMRDGVGPSMKTVTKSLRSKDTKRVHLPDGSTRPWKVVRMANGKEVLR